MYIYIMAYEVNPMSYNYSNISTPPCITQITMGLARFCVYFFVRSDFPRYKYLVLNPHLVAHDCSSRSAQPSYEIIHHITGYTNHHPRHIPKQHPGGVFFSLLTSTPKLPKNPSTDVSGSCRWWYVVYNHPLLAIYTAYQIYTYIYILHEKRGLYIPYHLSPITRIIH